MVGMQGPETPKQRKDDRHANFPETAVYDILVTTGVVYRIVHHRRYLDQRVCWIF